MRGEESGNTNALSTTNINCDFLKANHTNDNELDIKEEYCKDNTQNVM